MENKISVAIDQMIYNERHHKRMLDLCAEKIGIDRTRNIILINILKEGRSLSQTSLAKKLNLTPAAITIAIKKLEADGLVEKRAARDNRYNEITITESGKELLESTRMTFRGMDERIFADFTADELDTYTALMKKIGKNIDIIIESEKL